LSALRARSRPMAASAPISGVPRRPASASRATDCSFEIGTPNATTAMIAYATATS
jgi:hypothetical protein